MTFYCFLTSSTGLLITMCRWNLRINFILCKDTTPNPIVLDKILTFSTAMTKKWRITRSFYCLLFPCAYQLVPVVIQAYLLGNLLLCKEIRKSSPTAGHVWIKSHGREIWEHTLPFSLSAFHKMFQAWIEKWDFWFSDLTWAENRQVSPMAEITTELTSENKMPFAFKESSWSAKVVSTYQDCKLSY